jgi:Fur family peroxide stress response transcriptional regulator
MTLQPHHAPDIEEFKVLLRKYDLKATPQRLAVHQAMLALGHASADMVTEEIRTNSTAKITVATVYNILTQLALLGIYQHRLSSNNKMYFDVNTFRHIHLYDTVNNSYKDVIDDDLMDDLDKWLGKRKFKGYKVDGFDLQILCHPSRMRKIN